MAEEAKGQAPAEQPTPFEAALAIIEKEEENRPRDDKGRYVPKAEAKSEDAQPQAEATEGEGEAAEPKEEQPEIKPETRRFKLKYKGEEKEVEEPDVITLAQMGYDYTQKSQALAKEREELPLRLKAEVDARTKHYSDNLETFKQAILRMADPEVLQADLNKLANEDPAKALQLMLKRQQIGQAMQAIEVERQRIAQQHLAEARSRQEKATREALERIQQEIPDWSNEKYGKILKTAVDYGYKQDEANAIIDPRQIKLLHDAMEYRALKAKPLVDKRAAAANPKVVKPGSAEKPDAKSDEWKQGMANLKKSGKQQDAIPLFMKLLEEEGIK